MELYEYNVSGVLANNIEWQNLRKHLYFDYFDYDYSLKALPTYQSLTFFAYQPESNGTYLIFTDNETQIVSTFTLETTGKSNFIDNVGDIKYENPLVNSIMNKKQRVPKKLKFVIYPNKW